MDQHSDRLLEALKSFVEDALAGALDGVRDSVRELDSRLSRVADEIRAQTREELEAARKQVLEKVESAVGETTATLDNLEAELVSRVENARQEAAGEIENLGADFESRLDPVKRDAEAAKQEAEQGRLEAETVGQNLSEVEQRTAGSIGDLEGKLEEVSGQLDRRIESALEPLRTELARLASTLTATHEELMQHKAGTERLGSMLDGLSRVFGGAGRRPRSAESEADEPGLAPADRDELENALDRAFSNNP